MSNNKFVKEFENNTKELKEALAMMEQFKDLLTPKQKAEIKEKLGILQGKLKSFNAELSKEG